MAGSAGRSCTDDEVRLVNVYDDRKAEPDDTVPCDNKTEGEIIIKCPNKTTYCYVNNEKATKDKFYKGWMYTGDIGTWNSEQFVTIAGRKDDMIIFFSTSFTDISTGHSLVKPFAGFRFA